MEYWKGELAREGFWKYKQDHKIPQVKISKVSYHI